MNLILGTIIQKRKNMRTRCFIFYWHCARGIDKIIFGSNWSGGQLRVAKVSNQAHRESGLDAHTQSFNLKKYARAFYEKRFCEIQIMKFLLNIVQ